MFSTKILFILISTVILQFTSQEKQIRGLPGEDYPTYYTIPKTSFRCSDQLYYPGFYADTETRCQVFHYCYEHRQESFLCPMGTIFNQPILACDYWYSSNCSLAPSYYHANSHKRDEEQFDEAEDPLDSQSPNVFDKMAHLYETNKSPESPNQKNVSDIPENEFFLARDDFESSGEPLTDENDSKSVGIDYNKYNYDNQFHMVDEEHPEVVKYEVKGSENDHPYETDNIGDLIFSEDAMLYPSGEEIYQMFPTDMDFDQGYSGYAEIPSEGNFNFELNSDFDTAENDIQISDFILQKRHSDVDGDYVRRRPFSRKPIIVISESEPKIVQLPVAKKRRRPIVGTSPADSESSYKTTTYDSNTYEDTAMVANEGFEGTTSSEFPVDEPNSDLNEFGLRDPYLFYTIHKTISDEDASQLHQTDSLSVIYDNSNRKTRNVYLLSNIDDNDGEISSVFGSGSDDLLSISNVDASEVITANSEDSSTLPSKSLDTTDEDESSFDGDPFLGSGSEEINQSHSSNEFSFTEDRDVFSDSEDTGVIYPETSNELPMDISDDFEGSGISVQKTADMPHFTEEVDEPVKFVSEDNIEHGRKSEVFEEKIGEFSPVENSADSEGEELAPDDDGGFNDFNYLPLESQDSFDNPHDASHKVAPEVREIDGSYYYVFSDSEHHSNYEYDDSSGFYSENVDYAVTEKIEDDSNKLTEEPIDNGISLYIPTESHLEMGDSENGTLLTLDSENSRHLETNYEKLSDEFEAEISSSDVPEEYIVDDSDDDTRQLSTEDIKFLELMSQNPSPILKNLFEVSYEKSSSDTVKGEMHRIEIISPEQVINEETTHEDLGSTDAHEFESLSFDISSDSEHSTDLKSSDINSEILVTDQTSEVANANGLDEQGPQIYSDLESSDINSEILVTDQTSEFSNANGLDEQGSQIYSDLKSSDINSEILVTDQTPEFSNANGLDEQGSQIYSDLKSSDINSEILVTDQTPEVANGLDEQGSQIFSPEQKVKTFVPGKEADPFGPLFPESDKALPDVPEGKQKLSSKIFRVQPTNIVVNPGIGKDLKKVSREKRFSENPRTFLLPNQGNPMTVPRKDTFREAMFANIPSAFLKMKHSTLRPYFLNYDLKNSGFNPRTGDLYESSKLSKLTSLGQRLLAAKGTKFNRMKKYINSYIN